METGLTGLDEVPMPEQDEALGGDPVRGWLGEFVPFRILRIAQAMRSGMSVDELAAITGWDS